MPNPIIAHSTVADGTMLNRKAGYGVPDVIENRRRWLSPLGIPIENTYRVVMSYDDDADFCVYREINPDDAPADRDDGGNAVADALVTTQPGQAIILPVADCIAAVLYDDEHGVLMVSHLGRHSLEKNGGVKSVEYLARHYGTRPENLKIWLSATISKDLYKIYALDNKGMKEALYEQLKQAGIDFDNIQDTPHDTGTHDDYYSHSEFLKGNKADEGRHAIVAMML